jgi:hypothetical protein
LSRGRKLSIHRHTIVRIRLPVGRRF